MTAREKLDETQGYIDANPHSLVMDVYEEFTAALAALRAVLDVHEPFGSDPGICAGCEHYAPCPTVRAITDKLDGGA